MLIDLHAHSSGISKCCRIAAPEVIKRAKKAGIEGIVLTNHYQKSYITDGDVPAFAKRYMDEYSYAADCGKQVGFPVYFGVEVTMELYHNVHLLIYGVDEMFVINHPYIFDYTLEELYKLVKENDGTLIQAHPFRNGSQVLDLNYLDGIEINCHPLYKKSDAEKLIEIANASGVILTCGADYHADTYRAHCGTYLPEEVNNDYRIGEFLRTTDKIKLCIHEPGEEQSYDFEFLKS